MPAPYAAYLITQVNTLICLHGRATSCAEMLEQHDPEDVHFLDGSRTYEGAWAMAESKAEMAWADGRGAVVVCAEAWRSRAVQGTVN